MDPSLQTLAPEPEYDPAKAADRDWLLIASERLTSVTRSVASAVSFEEMLRAVAEASVGIGDAEASGIYLLDPDHRWFTVGWEATIPEWPQVRDAGDRIHLREWHGMVEALQSGKAVPWQRSDPLLSDFERRHYTREGVGSGIDVPLVCRNETLGFLKLFRQEEREWNARDVIIASIVGSSIALALTSEQLLERALQQSSDQSALAALAQVAITPREPRDLLQRVAEQSQKLLPFPCVDIELWTPELDRVEIVAHAAEDGWPGPTNGVVFYPMSIWPSVLRMHREQRMFTNDVNDELPEVERRYFATRDLVQLHYVPLMYGERCLGTIMLHSRERVTFDQRLTNLVQEIAAITTLAAHAARSIRETVWESRAKDWQLRVNRMLLNDAPISTVIDEAMASLVDMTGASSCVVEIKDPESGATIERRSARSAISQTLNECLAGHAHWPVVRNAIERQQLVIERISDSSVDPEVSGSILDIGPETIAVAPLQHDGESLGTLTLLHRPGVISGEDQLEFIRQMARQLALVATSHRLRLEQEITARRTAIVLKVSHAAVSISEPGLLLKEIAHAALEIDDVDGCEIERYDPATQLVYNDTIAFAGDWTYEYDPAVTHRIEDIPTFRDAIDRNEATAYLMSDPHVTDYERQAFRAIGVESVLVIPLSYGHKTLGVLTLLRLEPKPFNLGAIKLANELATHASLALGRAQLFEALRTRADSDGITGLANHRAILERIDAGLIECQASGSPLSLMLIDLDNFKQLNDDRGHLIGDGYLREIAKLIQDSIGSAGEAARYGGDEFLVVLPNCDAQRCRELAELLMRRSQDTTVTLDGEPVSCRFSVGLATAPLDGTTRDELIKHADLAMYHAKKHGGGRISG